MSISRASPDLVQASLNNSSICLDTEYSKIMLELENRGYYASRQDNKGVKLIWPDYLKTEDNTIFFLCLTDMSQT